MEREIVNPWQWQDQYGFVQANALTGVERVVLCAGQTSSDADGKHPWVSPGTALGCRSRVLAWRAGGRVPG